MKPEPLKDKKKLPSWMAIIIGMEIQREINEERIKTQDET